MSNVYEENIFIRMLKKIVCVNYWEEGVGVCRGKIVITIVIIWDHIYRKCNT